ESTAIFAPFGKTGGTSPHLMSPGVSIAMGGASASASGAARVTASSGTTSNVRRMAPSIFVRSGGHDAPSVRAGGGLWRETEVDGRPRLPPPSLRPPRSLPPPDCEHLGPELLLGRCPGLARADSDRSGIQRSQSTGAPGSERLESAPYFPRR